MLGGRDFRGIRNIRNITFSPTSTNISIQNPIINDDQFEVTEVFNARLVLNEVSISGVSASPDRTSIFIIDNDGKKSSNSKQLSVAFNYILAIHIMFILYACSIL